MSISSMDDVLVDWPKVSFLIPTYNADRYLESCLKSVFQQDYPINKVQVIVADGQSTDQTLDIVERYPVQLIQNPQRNAEHGKYLALQRADGEYIVLLDSDNILVGKHWLKSMIVALVNDREAVGIESEYLIANDFSLVNAYANTLVIVDPLARMLASKPSLQKVNGVLRKKFLRGSQPISGANGFIWKRAIIEQFITKNDSVFAEANLLTRINDRQDVIILAIPNVGIYHYYADTIADYFGKRKKIARKFLKRKLEGESTWVDGAGYRRMLVSSIFLVSIVGPLFEAIYMGIKQRRVSWMLHPVLSFATIWIYAFAFIKTRISFT